MPGRRCVFLDRDGTIVAYVPYLRAVADVRLLPGAAAGIRRLRAAGWLCCLVSNQGGVARGLLSEDDVRAVNARMCELLGAEGATLDDMRFCPHHPLGAIPAHRIHCECRKPGTALVRELAAAHDIDLQRSYFVGDSAVDVECGRRAGCSVLLLANKRLLDPPAGVRLVPDLEAAAKRILAATGGGAPGSCVRPYGLQGAREKLSPGAGAETVVGG